MTADTYAARRAVLRTLARLGPQAGAALRRSARHDQREHLAAALGELVAAGRIVAEQTAKGTRYRLTAPPRPGTPAPPGPLV